MWRCVDLALTDVSEESIASIFSVEKFVSGGTTMSRWLQTEPPVGNNKLSSPGFFFTPDRSSAACRHPCWFELHYRPYPSPLCWFPMWPTLSLSLFLYIWFALIVLPFVSYEKSYTYCDIDICSFERKEYILTPERIRRPFPETGQESVIHRREHSSCSPVWEECISAAGLPIVTASCSALSSSRLVLPSVYVGITFFVF
jgi:hypothetical protein